MNNIIATVNNMADFFNPVLTMYVHVDVMGNFLYGVKLSKFLALLHTAWRNIAGAPEWGPPG